MLLTSTDSKERVRKLQRTLYRKAKQQPEFRFYSLYDKVYRSDVLQRAYELVKQNKGSPGLDGVTFERIEQEKGKQDYLLALQEKLKGNTYQTSPIKRVDIPKGNGETRPLGIPCIEDRIVQMAVKLIIEPIFEAGFSQHSYGFRPKRSAHQAMDDITAALLKGYTQVIDADLSKYFDTIVHEKLMKTVAEKIADKRILALLNQWLKAIVVKVGKGGKKTVIGGGKKSKKGTPQGGVISPLLANIYLNILDRIWDKYQLAEKYKARIIRYADDLVILCKNGTGTPFTFLKKILNKLALRLNEDKTEIKDALKEKFNFLGFQIGMARSQRSGKLFPMVEPAAKSMKSIKEKIKFYTRRDMNPVPINEIVKKLNGLVRGWSNYFHYGYGHRKIKQIKYYMEESLRNQLRYRHKVKNKGASYQQFPRRYLYDYLGLYKPPIVPFWKAVQA
ncbi:MAG: group II intron reverse transcriptase/maturase [Thiohalomonadales bacterium]